MAEGAPPSRNPADDDYLAGTLRLAFKKSMQRTDDMLPVEVISYDRQSNKVRVAHFIQMVDTDGNLIDRAQVASIPALSLGGGGFTLNFHLPAGSKGWIKACDRDISLFLQNYTKAPPNDDRIHNFGAGLFIPDVMTGYTIAGEDDQACVLQSLDGNVKISLTNARIKLKAPLVEVDTPNANYTGNITAAGTITGDVDVVSQTISLRGHTHAQPDDGGGSTEAETEAPTP